MDRMAIKTGQRRRVWVSLAAALAMALPAVLAPVGLSARAHAHEEQPAGPNEAANILFVQAIQLIEDAEAAEDAASRLDLLRRAQANLDRIIQDHPASQLAVQLITRQRIGIFNPRDLDREIARAEDAVEDALAEAAAIEAMAEAEAEEERLCRDHPDACALFDEAAVVIGQIADDYHRLTGLARVAGLQATAGLNLRARRAIADVRRAANELDDRADRSLTLHIVAATLAEAALIAEAETTAALLDDGHSRLFLRSVIALQHARHLAAAGRTDEALSVFADAVTTAINDDRSDDLRISALATVARDQARAGFVEEARATLARLADDGGRDDLDVSTLAEIAGAQAAAGLADQARHTFDEALTAARQGHLSRVAREQALASFYEDAMVSAARIIDVDRRLSMLVWITRENARAGFVEQALAMADTIPDTAHKAEALWGIAMVQANAGQVDEAQQTAADAEALVGVPNDETSWAQVGAIAAIAGAQMTEGRTDLGWRTFADARSLALDTDDVPNQEAALLILSRTMAETAADLMGAE